jgi:hypothetical protein
MAIPEQTITGVSGLGATLLEFCGRQRRNSIPYQLKFSATVDATPVRWLPLVVCVPYFSHSDSCQPFDQGRRLKSARQIIDVSKN